MSQAIPFTWVATLHKQLAVTCKQALQSKSAPTIFNSVALGVLCVGLVALAMDDMRWQNRTVDLTARLDTIMKVSNDCDFWRKEARDAWDIIKRGKK